MDLRRHQSTIPPLVSGWVVGACAALELFGLFLAGGCTDGDGPQGSSSENGGTDLFGGGFANVDASAALDDAGTSSMFVGDALVMPSNFVKTEYGGYALGPALAEGADTYVTNANSESCSLLVGVVRDFLSYGLQLNGYPDFEHFWASGPTLGLVQSELGSVGKPVYAGECDDVQNTYPGPPCTSSQQLTTLPDFNQWYGNVGNAVNPPYLPYLLYFQFVPNDGVYTFEASHFFPLDDAGFGNTPGVTDDQGLSRNFSFTTELHLRFVYKGGETFRFAGDDDLWVFIDARLVLDLGGLHSMAPGSVDLDSLELARGTEYSLDLFHAERHSTGSAFRADTNLTLTSCGTALPAGAVQ
jgi:fibro-slime domain-containing protein